MLNSRAWFKRIHAGGGVQHQQHFVRGAGQLLVHDPMKLLQLLHQVVLGVQPAGGVHEQVVRFACLRGGYGVVGHRRRDPRRRRRR